jgi:hypothetical protein
MDYMERSSVNSHLQKEMTESQQLALFYSLAVPVLAWLYSKVWKHKTK